jgi:hypothetical protein
MKKLHQKDLKEIKGGFNRTCVRQCLFNHQQCIEANPSETGECDYVLDLCLEDCYS